MSQNRSSAVMQQRIEPDDSLDDFPTPPWATRALIEHVLRPLVPTQYNLIALEPCCNRGFMAKPLAEYFGMVLASDIFDYGWVGQSQVADFLFPGYEPSPAHGLAVDLTFANPPFRLAQQFIGKALEISRLGCAMFVRSAFTEGEERYDALFGPNPPTVVAQFAERVVLHKGVLRNPERKYWDADTGKWKRPSSATAYCWLLWLPGVARIPNVWIPPCRRDLERDGDYPINPDEQKETP